MRRHGRRDRNHGDIVAMARQCGATVVDLGDVGGDCPDLLIGHKGRNLLVEVKDGARPGAKLEPGQQTFRETWHGQHAVVTCTDELLTLLYVKG